MQVLQWFGYVKRIDINRIPTRALEIQMRGKRCKGQLMWRWHIQVTNSIKGTGNIWTMLFLFSEFNPQKKPQNRKKQCHKQDVFC